jgi:hypothetical protein
MEISGSTTEAEPEYTRMISYDKICEKLEALHVPCL